MKILMKEIGSCQIKIAKNDHLIYSVGLVSISWHIFYLKLDEKACVKLLQKKKFFNESFDIISFRELEIGWRVLWCTVHFHDFSVSSQFIGNSWKWTVLDIWYECMSFIRIFFRIYRVRVDSFWFLDKIWKRH